MHSQPSPTPLAATATSADAARLGPDPSPAASPVEADSSMPLADPAEPWALSIPPLAPLGASSHVIPGTTHVWQKWNNCGPSAVLMALSAYGLQLDQLDVAARLKPDGNDTNITPEELASYAREQGFAARSRLGGDHRIARELVRAGVPVAAEQWIDVDGRGEMGHYRVVIGYDDDAGEVITQDSYYGPARRYSYSEFDRMWRPFLGAYTIAYAPEQEPLVAAAIGSDWDDGAMRSRVLATAEDAAAQAPGDAWSWYVLGEARSMVGDHAGAVDAFDRARGIGLPYRAFWYQFGYYRSLIETGAFDRAVAHADETIATMDGENLEESHYWRGVALARLGRHEEAAESFHTALLYNPGFAPAAEALTSGP